VDKPVTTKERVLTQLRLRPRTIHELAAALGVTRNAVIVALQDLEARGLARKGEAERTGKAGKPAFRYELVAERFEKHSPAYQTIAPHLLKVATRGDDESVARYTEAVGRSMYEELSAGFQNPPGLDETLAFLSSQGAKIERVKDGEDELILSHSCPIGALVRAERRVCGAIASLLTKASGLPVKDECDYSAKLTCRFRVRGCASKTGGATRKFTKR
jgi:predicted ArsR family transcriptional regulator